MHMTTAKPLVQQVDHIIIRVNASSSDPLFSLHSAESTGRAARARGNPGDHRRGDGPGSGRATLAEAPRPNSPERPGLLAAWEGSCHTTDPACAQWTANTCLESHLSRPGQAGAQ